MDATFKRVSQIENILSMFLAAAKISEHIFIGKMPSDISKEWKEMVYVDVNPQTDRGGMTRGSANIYLYSKPTGVYSRKNVKQIDKMEAALDKALADYCNPHYVLQPVWRDAGYDKNLDFFFTMVDVSIIVK